MPVIEIVLERQSANDETAVVAAIFAESGTLVTSDEPLFEIENSKAVEEYRAPAAGVVIHQLKCGQVLSFGSTIATLAPADVVQGFVEPIEPKLPPLVSLPVTTVTLNCNQTASHPPADTAASAGDVAVHRPANASLKVPIVAGRPRASIAAMKLMQQHQLSTEHFTSSLITSKEVMLYVAAHTTSNVFEADPESNVSVKDRPALEVSRNNDRRYGRKRAEIDALQHGASNGTLSVLGVRAGKIAIGRPAGDPLTGLITDIVLYEASRLMQSFPRLNGHYTNEQPILEERVNGGLAMDRGGQLVVYGIEDSNTIELTELRRVMEDAVLRYMEDDLTAREMQRATFTVSDLSSSGIDFMFPLLPRGQSLILGITRDASDSFSVFAGFDHRMTEGLEVARFLNELRTRLRSFDSAKHVGFPSVVLCHYCSDTMSDMHGQPLKRGFLKLAISPTEEVLCCGSCWNGW